MIELYALHPNSHPSIYKDPKGKQRSFKRRIRTRDYRLPKGVNGYMHKTGSSSSSGTKGDSDLKNKDSANIKI